MVYEKAIRDDGSLFFPEKLTQEFLYNARRVMGSYIFSNQYQNEIVPDDLQTFKQEWFRYYSELPKIKNTFAMIDPAIGQDDHHDFTGIVVIDVDCDANWYIRVAKRGRYTPTEIIDLLFRINDQFKPKCIGVESVAFQKAILYMASEEMKKRQRVLPLKDVHPGTDKTKEMRISGVLVPRYEWGRIYHAKGLEDLETELLMFPRASHDDVCFVAGTQIATSLGNKSIETLKIGDKVLTPVGFKEITATSKRLMPVISSYGLIGTYNHPILCHSGDLIRLGSLTEESDVCRLATWSLIKTIHRYSSNLMENDIETLAARDVITYNTRPQLPPKKELKDSTSLFGNFIMVKLAHQSTTYITKMVIHLTIALTILNVYRLMNIKRFLKRWIKKKIEYSWLELGYWPDLGIKQMLDMNFIRLLEKWPGPKNNRLIEFVSFVQNHLSLGFQEPSFALAPASANNISDQIANLSTASSVESNQMSTNIQNQKRVLILNAEKNLAKEEKLVFNITVKEAHCYYANGILVSNCDCLSLLDNIVSYPEHERQKDVRPSSPAHPDYEKWFIRNQAKARSTSSEDY